MKISRSRLLLTAAVQMSAILVLSLGSMPAFSQDFEYKGQVSSDLRTALPGKDAPDDFPDFAWIRSDHRLRLTTAFSWSSVRAMADLSVVFSVLSEVNKFSDTLERGKVDPVYFESDALFVEIIDLIMYGMDLKIGRQIVTWGTADMFNPTSVINPYDIEDRLDFGKQIANEMVVLSVMPDWYIEAEDGGTIVDEVRLELIAVPFFRSAMFPVYGLSAFGSGDQFRRFVSSSTFHDLLDVLGHFEGKGGQVIFNDPDMIEPDWQLENTQLAARYGMSLLGVDFHVMYYYGFDKNPQPSVVAVETALIDLLPADIQLTDKDVLIGAIDAICPTSPCALLDDLGAVVADITLVYPRVHVVGFDFATSLDFLGGAGLWGEIAFTFHDGTSLDLESGTNVTPLTQVESGWFWKLTAGMDFTITEWWYVNVQYVHGFLDEFGTEFLRDYLIAGFDFKVFSEQVLIRLFGILSFNEPSERSRQTVPAAEIQFANVNPSFLAYPQLSFMFWQSMELTAGALIHVGSPDTKFGNRTSGPNTVFVKGAYAF